MAEEAISQKTLLKRLKRVEGQVRGIQGIQGMIENNCDGEGVITQLATVCSATKGLGGLILKNYMKLCFKDEIAPECVDVESLARAIAIWGRIHVGDIS